MIAISSPAEDSLAVDSRTTRIFVAIVNQLGVLSRVATSKIEREFATFANVPYQDRLSRQQWEQQWRAEPK
jgi:hypothetical protein